MGNVNNVAKPLDPAWAAFLERSRAIKKTDAIPAPETLTTRETLPTAQQAPLKKAVLLVPANPDPGVAAAIADLSRYLQTVTGQAVKQVVLAPGREPALGPDAEGATLIAVGQGLATSPALPAVTGQAEGYAIKASELKVGGKTYPVVGVTGDDRMGVQYGVYRLMELSGKRFYSYADTYTPPVGKAMIPVNGYSESHAPTSQMRVRGFSPHMYHPIPLSDAFHLPSAQNLDMMKRYIDWHVQTGQNTVMFPMLELDQKSGFLPITSGDREKFQAWLPHAKALVDYAHARGVKVSIKLAFANYVSSNAYAVNPLLASFQSIRLNGAWKKVEEAKATLEQEKAKVTDLDKRLGAAAPKDRAGLIRQRANATKQVTEAESKLAAATKGHAELLKKYGDADEKKIQAMIDRFMAAGWDDIAWNLGTSEFTPTNDDLTIRWMNDAVKHLKANYPGVTTTARSHVPSHPYSEKYDDSYFNLPRFADPGMGQLVHTTHHYGLLDKAPVYGNQDFSHKLKQLYLATPERTDIYYPETSYWVAHDVSVPLFLPVYMLNRRHDLEIVKGIEHLDGHMGFTTGWEWGYWLNDYALARMQHHPDESLTQILDGAFAPFGEARTPMVRLMNEAMLAQQDFLLDKNLIRHVQGFDQLTDFGAFASENPLLGKVLKGTNTTPNRLRASEILSWDAEKLMAFENGELSELRRMARTFQGFSDRAEALRAVVDPAAEKYHDELADGFKINALRAQQALACLSAEVAARRYALTQQPIYRDLAKAQLATAKQATEAAMALIANREADYREGPEYTTDKGEGPTLWNDHYLTPVHTGKYWTNTLEEAEKAVEKALK